MGYTVSHKLTEQMLELPKKHSHFPVTLYPWFSVMQSSASTQCAAQLGVCESLSPLSTTIRQHCKTCRTSMHVMLQVVDSPFSKLTELMLELVEEQKIPIPRSLMRVALTMMRRSVKKRAGFSIDEVAPIEQVHKAFIPCLFGEMTPLLTWSCCLWFCWCHTESVLPVCVSQEGLQSMQVLKKLLFLLQMQPDGIILIQIMISPDCNRRRDRSFSKVCRVWRGEACPCF